MLTIGVYAQKIKFKTYSVEQGLSQSTVNAILQDKDGFMWMATQDGLNRFDAYNFSVLKNNPADKNSVADNYIQSLQQDQNGNIWIGTYSEGVSVFNPLTRRYTHIKSVSVNETSSTSYNVMGMVEDGAYMWIATTGGLVKVNTGDYSIIRYQAGEKNGLISDQIRSVIKTRSGAIWVACANGGVLKFNRSAGKFEPVVEVKSASSDVSFANPWHIMQHSSGNVFVSYSGGGLVEFNSEGTAVIRQLNTATQEIISNDIWCSAEDNEHNVWFGSYGQGLFRLNYISGFIENYVNDNTDKYSLPNNEILSIYRDRQGALWVGTLGGGVAYFEPNSASFIQYGTSGNYYRLNESMVMSVLGADGKLYVGTFGGGLNIIDNTTRKVEYLRHEENRNSIGSDIIRSIFRSSDGLIYIGTYGGGLSVYDPQKKTMRNYVHDDADTSGISANDVWCVTEDKKGMIWLGTWGGGLNQFNPKTGKFISYRKENSGISGNKVISLAFDKNGLLWIGTNGNGLNSFDTENKTFTVYKNDKDNPKSIGNNRIRSILVDDKNNLWLGTDGAGLNYFDRAASTFYRYTEIDGLPNNVVYGILQENKRYLWLSTNNGLCRFDIENKTAKNFSEKDGLQSNEFNQGAYYRDQEGIMYFGGINGLNKFVPSKIQSNMFLPPVRVTKITVNDSDLISDTAVHTIRNLVLNYNQNFISFEFAALNFKNAELNSYQCKMEGLDENWINLGQRRFISYTNLDPGTYTFRIRASNNDGLWNNEGTYIQITIIPPFWKTWWFYLLVVVAFVFVLVSIYRIRVRSLQRAKQLLENEVEARTSEIKVQNAILERKNRDITDSINYAKKIQEAILPSDDSIRSMLNDAFVLYLPKDIVAGDFYWFEKKDHLLFFAAADCTGHGVPGAMVSVICSNALNRTVKELNITDPGKILDKVRDLVLETFEKSGNMVHDGMDISLCCMNAETRELFWAGANNPLWIATSDMHETGQENYSVIVNDGKKRLLEFKADKQPIGKYAIQKPFTTHHYKLRSGDVIYLFTDGFADQFGGPQGKKFKYKQLANTLLSNSDHSVNAQKERLHQTFEKWRGDKEQIDDVCVIGVRV
ncbi:MAG: hypothetical protein Fur0041_15660 [Bacteroidia bacterium]